LEFLGRRDSQVKIGGHRIELGEVEAALCAGAGVGAAVVVVLGERVRKLAALVVAAGGGSGVDERGLRRLCERRLPGYMVPERIVVADAVPLTGNGKVDRAAVVRLLAAGGAGGEVWRAPVGVFESTLAGLWAELLEVPRVGRDDNFFALGGDSLLATRLVAAVRARLGAGVTLRQLLAAPVLHELATHIQQQAVGQDADAVEEGVL
jgi:aryl carrier-like protein